MKTTKRLVLKKLQGLSLVEVVVFVAIFSTSLVLLLASVVYSSLVFKNSQNKLMATHNAEQIAEWLTYQREMNNIAPFLTKALPQLTPIPTTSYSCTTVPTPVGATATPCPLYTTPVPTVPYLGSGNTYCLENNYLGRNVSQLSAGYCSGFTDNYKREVSFLSNATADRINVYIRIYWKERLSIKKVEVQQSFNKYND